MAAIVIVVPWEQGQLGSANGAGTPCSAEACNTSRYSSAQEDHASSPYSWSSTVEQLHAVLHLGMNTEMSKLTNYVSINHENHKKKTTLQI
ncbi:hypothetical protein [Oryza sativa Japonica Group]|uniref:Uncharacterized protein n=5 Tax=Oryza TaxID=4527 RepID=A2ZVS8_ORYSJ|nr:hypothetical protein OsJ_02746 [Oryza sativa Japonica Group]BAC16689.1 hypothetical protein [Oryza sativa Japonica Group]